MLFLDNFLIIFLGYIREVWWVLAIGFFLSGLINQFISTNLVEKYLGRKGLRPILISAVIGVFLPVCCIGSLPVANTLWKKGARLGAVLTFLVATPATSISALLMTLKFMGGVFTIYLCFAVFLISIILGLICETIPSKDISCPKNEETKSCCHDSHSHAAKKVPIFGKISAAFRYAFVTLPKEMGLEIILGLALASVVMAVPAIQDFIGTYLTGIIGYISIAVFGLFSYVCSTASVPMADAFVKSGMSAGQSMCYLLLGPITSLATILIVRKDFGNTVLKIYLGVIVTFAIMLSVFYDVILKGL